MCYPATYHILIPTFFPHGPYKNVDAVFDAITQGLRNGETVNLVGFGTFSVGERAARSGRNPRTGETIDIAASRNPRFKAGKGLKDAVN